MKKTLPYVLGHVETERDAQDEEWGGPAHDDRHDQDDWTEQINRQLTFALAEKENYQQWRSRLIKIAALAVAGSESQDRIRYHQITRENSSFEDWIEQLREIGIIYHLYSNDSEINVEVWRVNYENGETPLEAVVEDLSNM